MLGGCYLGVGRAKGVPLPESTSVARTTEASRSMSSTEKHTGLQGHHMVCILHCFTTSGKRESQHHRTATSPSGMITVRYFSFSVSHTLMILPLIPSGRMLCSNSSSFFMSLTISELVWPLLKQPVLKLHLCDVTVV